ncbi:MAG: hypothetical protein DHS20C19_21960 [Acidimicrobiales bacterium]|nr:MAG: hypothetical protein DHS20C19_21960 [Acidimicrobiales bacterium]
MNSATHPLHLRGRTIDFVTFEGWFSRWLAQVILDGQTYPIPPFVSDVQVILDVGANCGAASTYFADHFPDAKLYAFEPAAATFAILERNVERLPNVTAFNFGLHDHDATVQLFGGVEDPATASVVQGREQTGESETIEVKDAGAWVAASGLDRIDILKVDTEGCEVEIFGQILDLVSATTKVVYLEYHSDEDRRTLDAMLSPSHKLVYGQNHLDTGELTYLSRRVVEGNRSEIVDWIEKLFGEELRGSAARIAANAPES